jgi:hypothetical protein
LSSNVEETFSGCEGEERGCRDLCRTITDFPATEGVESKMEYSLLQHGCYEVKPFNLLSYSVCQSHLKPIESRKITSCSICKPFFSRQKASRSDLRVITKQHAFVIWRTFKKSFFGKIMCGNCRRQLQTIYLTDELKEESIVLFKWIYDFNVVHTPSTISSQPHSTSYSGIYSGVAHDDQEMLKNLLKELKFSNEIPTTVSYSCRSPKSKQNFCRSSKNILQFILEILAPNDFEEIWDDIVASSYDLLNESNFKMDNDFQTVMRGLAEAYENCEDWNSRRQILSIFAKEVPLSSIRRFIPDLSSWSFTRAREHADFGGKGTTVDTAREPTIRYDDEQIAHFVEFITSPHISTDLPFGQKILKLSTGEQIEIPNVIPNMIPTKIIDQYLCYSAEMSPGFQVLGKSSLFSILTECSASTRKSLQGLDYFSADGSSSFDTLMKMVDELGSLGKNSSLKLDPEKVVRRVLERLHYSFTSSVIALASPDLFQLEKDQRKVIFCFSN